ncbi:radical SAM protein [Streptomyces sp. 4F14]|uniref:radical SAM protein n=1 Tax=Streptomyces sp. 4F14 TaxID=3394380 RepID=UPI003A899126
MSRRVVEEVWTPRPLRRTRPVLWRSGWRVRIYLLGGEPTTHPELDAILDVCKAQDYKTVLTSNGLIPPKTWPVLDERLDSFSFSMDGARRETHETMRGPGTWKPLLRSMTRAVEAGFQTRAIFTVTTDNQPDAIDLVDRIGLEMISFHYSPPLSSAGPPRTSNSRPPPGWSCARTSGGTPAACASASSTHPP